MKVLLLFILSLSVFSQESQIILIKNFAEPRATGYTKVEFAVNPTSGEVWVAETNFESNYGTENNPKVPDNKIVVSNLYYDFPTKSIMYHFQNKEIVCGKLMKAFSSTYIGQTGQCNLFAVRKYDDSGLELGLYMRLYPNGSIN